MKKFNEFIRQYGLSIIFILIIIIFFRGCGSNSTRDYQYKQTNQRIDSLITVMDGVKLDINTKVVKAIRIEGLETEKRTLLNTNQIFLTKKRPDERVIEIDKELSKLRE